MFKLWNRKVVGLDFLEIDSFTQIFDPQAKKFSATENAGEWRAMEEKSHVMKTYLDRINHRLESIT